MEMSIFADNDEIQTDAEVILRVLREENGSASDVTSIANFLDDSNNMSNNTQSNTDTNSRRNTDADPDRPKPSALISDANVNSTPLHATGKKKETHDKSYIYRFPFQREIGFF